MKSYTVGRSQLTANQRKKPTSNIEPPFADRSDQDPSKQSNKYYRYQNKSPAQSRAPISSSTNPISTQNSSLYKKINEHIGNQSFDKRVSSSLDRSQYSHYKEQHSFDQTN